MTKLVYGVGINDGKYPTKINGKTSKDYDIWQHILARCYSAKAQKRQPAYIGCSVSTNFQNFSFFSEWCRNQIGFGSHTFQLDKDLIQKGNKLYSENTCLFLPSELNKLLTTRKVLRGKLPVGVSAYGNKFLVQCHAGNSIRRLGLFSTVEEAFNAYKQAKENYIKAQAENWKYHIDPRAFTALMAYEVSISD